ncbi:MAG: glycerol-3-phosphate 1-O-acyltransferase PlsY [Candidatus Paracaedibacter sp.]|jgi:glycerol-3-phosphate acyltransferase PlsY
MNYFFILLAYLSGSVPYGLIFAKLFGDIDVRKIGSGNIGATNVLRTGQKGIAAATLICDALKGFFPVFLASHIGIEGALLLTVAFAAILGHVFPIWLRYQGGKGVATSLGVFWALSLPLGGFSTFMWIVITRFIKISSLSSLCIFALSPLFAALILSWPVAVFCFFTALLIFWTHRSNIQRLISGTESEIGETE